MAAFWLLALSIMTQHGNFCELCDDWGILMQGKNPNDAAGYCSHVHPRRNDTRDAH